MDPDSAISCKTACFMMLLAKHRIYLTTDSQGMTLPQPKVNLKEIIHCSYRSYNPAQMPVPGAKKLFANSKAQTSSTGKVAKIPFKRR